MTKIIAVLNMTFDGFCDHTAMITNEEMHQHYIELFADADMILYGRKTYQLMSNYWTTVMKKPTGNKQLDEFAATIDAIKKIVFSETIRTSEWTNTKLKSEVSREQILNLMQQAQKNILVGSPSLIVALTKLNLIDEYQINVHPIIAGKGLPLFKGIHEKINLKLIKTKTFDSGVVTFYYQPLKTEA